MKISCMWYKLTPFIQLSVTTKCMTGTTPGHMVRSTTTSGAAVMKKRGKPKAAERQPSFLSVLGWLPFLPSGSSHDPTPMESLSPYPPPLPRNLVHLCPYIHHQANGEKKKFSHHQANGEIRKLKLSMC